VIGKISAFGLFLTLMAVEAFGGANTPDTKYTYYLIGGGSAASLHDAMLLKGPRVGNGKAYASAQMEPRITAKTIKEGASCGIHEFKIDMTFTIRLPQLRKGIKLDTATRRRFEEFYRLAKRHEETHRRIWLSCAAEAEALVQNVSAKTCSQAEARGVEVVNQAAKRCDARQVKFDSAEQRRLLKNPFIQQISQMQRHHKMPQSAVERE
jgi:predicted secreted Zn-dependent protease